MIIVVFTLILHALADSTQCYNDWANLFAASQSVNLTSDYFKMFQYSGFTINDLGNYNGCNEISIAKYAVIEISASPRIVQTICGPQSCSKADYYNTSMPYFTSPQFDVIFSYEYQQNHYSDYSGSAITMIILVIILAGLVFISTVLEIISEDEQGNYRKVLSCFSLKRNILHVIRRRPLRQDGSEETMDVFDGIKVLGIGWIIYGQTLMAYNQESPVINYSRQLHETTESSFILAYGANLAPEYYFWISGLMITYLFLSKYANSSELTPLNLGQDLIKRLWRIMPTYMFVLFFIWTTMVHIGNGPMWYYINERINSDCDEYWYSNLLFITNFIPSGRSSYCLKDSWVITCLIQLFVFNILLLVFYLKGSKVVAWVGIVAIVIINITVTAAVMNYYHLIITQESLSEYYNKDIYNYFWSKLYVRMGAYTMGIATGLVIYSYRVKQETGRTVDWLALTIGQIWDNQYVRYIGTPLGFILTLVQVFFAFSNYRHLRNDYSYSDFEEQLYYIEIGFRRSIFVIVNLLIFMPMVFGHFKNLRMFFANTVLNFLAKFVFGMFLVCHSVIQTVLLSVKTSPELNFYNVTKDSVFFFVLIFLCSIPIVFLLELPAVNLRDLIFPSPQRSYYSKEEKSNLLSDQD